MDIKEIALKVADSLRNKVDGVSHMQSNQGLVRFAEALIESYKAELLNEVGGPVAYFSDEFFSVNTKQNATFNEPLFTSDQLAAAILKATKPLEDQLAAAQEEIKTVTEQKNRMWFEMQSAQNQLVTAEQRVAESCAKWIDGYAGIHQKEMLSDTAKSFADALRRGEWRKFVKEV